ncbi:DUF721 domain-containing protein [Nitratireductor indicus]|uniref:DUF721 domain-containing protein n=1 Tax=Nitratireductor indicus TaxID=721133 RepID=UPI0028767923|nr:DciA family protein [Nitratireductor indicus]MDS1138525.1 DciA family protein [Nitratireductor indicus]
MAGNEHRSNPVAVSDLVTGILDPVMRKRAGISVELVQSWSEIVGNRLAGSTRPAKLAWPRRMHEDDPFEPATLVIACEGASALRLQHETGEVIGRVNAFLGFAAVGRIRIVQKPVAQAQKQKAQPRRALTGGENERLSRLIESIEDEGLRNSLRDLGASVFCARK